MRTSPRDGFGRGASSDSSLPLPRYSPELNPAERLWLNLERHIDVTVQAVREHLVALRDHVAERLCSYTLAQMQLLTGYGWLVDAVAALG